MSAHPILSTPPLRRSLLSAVLLAGALAVAALCSVTTRSATLAGLRGPRCALSALLGERACPGCGLTRATSLAVQGRVPESLAVHPAGILVAALCAAGLLVHLHVLWRRRRTPGHDALLRIGRWLFTAGILAGWMVAWT